MRKTGFRGFNYEKPPETADECSEILLTVNAFLSEMKIRKEAIYKDEKAGIPVDASEIQRIIRSVKVAQKTREFLDQHKQKLKHKERLTKIERSEAGSQKLIHILRGMVTEEQFKEAAALARGEP